MERATGTQIIQYMDDFMRTATIYCGFLEIATKKSQSSDEAATKLRRFREWLCGDIEEASRRRWRGIEAGRYAGVI